MDSLSDRELPPFPTMKTTCLDKRLMESHFRIRDAFDSSQRGQTKRVPTMRSSSSLPESRFIEQKPCFLHFHWDHAHRWRIRLQRCANLSDPGISLDAFCIAVNEEKVAREKLNGANNPFFQISRRAHQPPKICPLGTEQHRGILSYEPIQNRHQHFV
jgi:hypothetical protein